MVMKSFPTSDTALLGFFLWPQNVSGEVELHVSALEMKYSVELCISTFYHQFLHFYFQVLKTWKMIDTADRA